MCLGIVGGCGGDPVRALCLRNAAEYRLPTFGPHFTKQGHSRYQWIIKSDFSGWFDNSKKGEVSGQIEWMGCWSRGCTPPQEHCRLPPTYFWTTWHQTRAFLIAVKNKTLLMAGWTILKKKMCLGIWAFLISVKNKKRCGRLVWQFWKRRCVWADWENEGLILWLHSTYGMLQTTAYLLLDHMAPN